MGLGSPDPIASLVLLVSEVRMWKLTRSRPSRSVRGRPLISGPSHGATPPNGGGAGAESATAAANLLEGVTEEGVSADCALREAAAPPDPLADLARRAVEGDHAAANALLTALTPALLRVARQILGAGHPEVNDVTQEAACGVLLALPRFRGESTLVHFACRVAVLVAMNVRRRQISHARKAENLSVLQEVYPVGTLPPTPEDRLLGERAADAIRELLGSLPEAQAEVLGLHHAVGLTVSEIAALTGARHETVRSRLRLGRQAVRQRVLGDQRLLEVVGGSDEHR
jgi:RNA polymerase sigma-70 factor (ECF subfamily)